MFQEQLIDADEFLKRGQLLDSTTSAAAAAARRHDGRYQSIFFDTATDSDRYPDRHRPTPRPSPAEPAGIDR